MRGLVMVLMVLDHASVFFNASQAPTGGVVPAEVLTHSHDVTGAVEPAPDGQRRPGEQRERRHRARELTASMSPRRRRQRGDSDAGYAWEVEIVAYH